MMPQPAIPRHRFHCPVLAAPQGVVKLESEQGQHAVKVLRLREGDGIELFDGLGQVGQGQIASIRRDEVMVRIASVVRIEPVTPGIDVAVALPKGARVEDMVNQLVQVGVDRLMPMLTARASVDPRENKLQRLRRVAIDAARQSRRAWGMAIDDPRALSEVLSEPYDLRLIATPGAAAIDGGRITAARRVLVLIGPEGGWTDDEQAAAHIAECMPWGLGPHVMRIETAAVAAAAILRHATCSLR